MTRRCRLAPVELLGLVAQSVEENSRVTRPPFVRLALAGKQRLRPRTMMRPSPLPGLA
jgi:hypothetical protein